MKTEGRINNIQITYPSHKAVISIEVTASPSEIERYMEKDLDVTIAQHREHRGLSQNNYYWVLLTPVAAKLRVSTAYLHNQLLRIHPRLRLIGNYPQFVLIPNTEEAWNLVMETTDYHLIPTNEYLGDDRKYMMIRGSSDYNTEEMSVLLDDLIEVAKGQGIETATPEEIARMRQYGFKDRETQQNEGQAIGA